jgi:transcriptional regulator with XRE-family HTH domain
MRPTKRIPESDRTASGEARSRHLTVREHVAGRLRLLREKRGLSEASLAKKLGLSPAVLNSYESGLRPMGAGTLFELATALDTPVGAFFENLPPTARSGDNDEDAEGDLVELLLRIKDPALLTRLADLVRHLATHQK